MRFPRLAQEAFGGHRLEFTALGAGVALEQRSRLLPEFAVFGADNPHFPRGLHIGCFIKLVFLPVEGPYSGEENLVGFCSFLCPALDRAFGAVVALPGMGLSALQEFTVNRADYGYFLGRGVNITYL